MAWLIPVLNIISIVLQVWADRQSEKAQEKDTEHAYKQADKWANRARNTGDLADRLRKRAESKRAKSKRHQKSDS